MPKIFLKKNHLHYGLPALESDISIYGTETSNE